MTTTDNLPAPIKCGTRGLQPRDFDQQWRMAVAYHRSGLTPFKSPEEAFVAIQKALELGLPSSSVTDSIAVVKGKASVYGKAGKAVVRAHPLCEDMECLTEGEGDAMVAVCRIKRRGCDWTEARFSVEDAKIARLWGSGDNWRKYPRDMLGYKAFSRCAGTAIPEALCGVPVYEDYVDVGPRLAEPVRQAVVVSGEGTPDPLIAQLCGPGDRDDETERGAEVVTEDADAAEAEDPEPDPDDPDVCPACGGGFGEAHPALPRCKCMGGE